MKAEDFGKYLRSLRKVRKLTVRQLDTYSGVSHSYISQMERGVKGIPSPEILKKLAKPLGVEYEELMEKAGYITKEDILKSALPDMSFTVGPGDGSVSKEQLQEMFDLLKNDPDEFLNYLDDDVKSEFYEQLLKNMPKAYYDQIRSNYLNKVDDKVRQILNEVNDLTDDRFNQVVDFIRYLKSKD